uniref:Uncharacterized protein n=1 Tax=Glossina palpalis gambiensis TaxID=67801 RepID=A0A1B0BLB6_9MUSC
MDATDRLNEIHQSDRNNCNAFSWRIKIFYADERQGGRQAQWTLIYFLTKERDVPAILVPPSQVVMFTQPTKDIFLRRRCYQSIVGKPCMFLVNRPSSRPSTAHDNFLFLLIMNGICPDEYMASLYGNQRTKL